MIQLPRRSVTRFFIPLVDVMILLFSMFMLMPVVQKAAEGGQEGSERSAEELREDMKGLERELRRRSEELQRLQKLVKPQEDLTKLKEELERLRKEKIKVLQQRLAVRVLEIDPKSGNLAYYEAGQPPRRHVIDSAATAAESVRTHRREAGPRELYYVISYPRVNSIQPTAAKLAKYNEWLKDAAFGFDVPDITPR
jgi:hypothetical protein